MAVTDRDAALVWHAAAFTLSLTDGDLVWAEQPAKSDIDATLDDLAAGVIVKRRRVLRIRWRDDVEARRQHKRDSI